MNWGIKMPRKSSPLEEQIKTLASCGIILRDEPDKRFTYLDLGGQDCLIGCCTPRQLASLNKNTGLNFEWLT